VAQADLNMSIDERILGSLYPSSRQNNVVELVQLGIATMCHSGRMAFPAEAG